MRYALFTLCSFLLFNFSVAQDIGQLGFDKGIKLSGGINLSTVAYQAYGINQRRDPFNWFATGNLSLSIFGYAAPLSFSISNANRTYSQPFNQIAFAPQYKWVRTYIGFSSMTFSKYTLAGHVFLGGGIELSPGKWRIAAMYGRLRQAVPFSLTDTLQYPNASFRRMGYGLKLGYENNGNAVYINIFAAKDDPTSLSFIPSNAQLTPMQNLAASIAVRKRFLKYFFIDGEYALSVLNKNILANSSSDSPALKTGSNFLAGLFSQNATSRYFDAINTSFGFQKKWYTIQVKYERVAPEYQTLGAYYFNNDLQNITIAPTVRLLKSTLTISANVGQQTNNLDNTRASTTKRTVGSINVNFVPNEKWNLSGNYSNFTTFTNVKKYNDPYFQNKLDTLNFYQISQALNAAIVRNFGSKKKPQSLMANLGLQNANDHSAGTGSAPGSKFISVNVSYSYTFPLTNTSIASSGNIYHTTSAGIETVFWGPSVSATKSLMERQLRLAFSLAYNQTNVSTSIQSSPLVNNRINILYAPKSKRDKKSKQTFSFSLNTLWKTTAVGTQPAYSELTGTLNYAYTF